MPIEFRLGHQDHKKVEDFLASAPAGVGAITLDTKAAAHQEGAAEAARDAGVAVLFEPATERLCDPGFDLPGLSYSPAQPYDLDSLVSSPEARRRLVEQVIESHPDFATVVTVPHFFVTDERTSLLNIDLAEATAQQSGVPTRATLVIAREYAAKNGIDNPRWHLLTGSKATIYDLARRSYFAEEEPGFTKDSTEFLHTEHFLLVDKNKRIRGIYNGTLQTEIQQLIEDIRVLRRED